MKPEDLPTPHALEKLFEEFLRKTYGEEPQQNTQQEEGVKKEAGETSGDSVDVNAIIETLDKLEGENKSPFAKNFSNSHIDDFTDKGNEVPGSNKECNFEKSNDSDFEQDSEQDSESDLDGDWNDPFKEEDDDDEAEDLDIDPLMELMNMTGLEEVKRAVNQQISYNRIMKMRKDAGKRVPKRLMHLLLTGNPGTGKTTVAKLIGRIYRKEGILRRGHVVETNRACLVGEYIGQAEQKTLEKIEEARDGILFIDEIYSLVENGAKQSDHEDYGYKVIDTLIPVMDKADSNIVIIGAGYPNNMRHFLDANPGLKSRFPTVLDFKDFTIEELKEIAINLLKKYDFTYTEEFLKGLDLLLKKAIRIKDHGNARMVNTIINTFVIPNLCTRIASSPKPVTDIEQTSLVLVKDLPTLEQLFPLEEKRRQMGYS